MPADVAETVFYTEDSASPLTVSKPAAFAAGQMLVVVHFGDVTGLSGPGTWTEEENPVSIVLQYGKVYSHVYDSGDPSTWDFVYGSGAATALALLRITGADVETPGVVVATPTTSTSNGASVDSPSLTPTGNDDLLIATLSSNGNNAAFSSTHPSGMVDLGQTQLGNLWQGIAAASEQLASGAATGVRTWTSVSPTGRSVAAMSIAILSASGSGDAGRKPQWNTNV